VAKLVDAVQFGAMAYQLAKLGGSKEDVCTETYQLAKLDDVGTQGHVIEYVM
jgi:hypothetical protein